MVPYFLGFLIFILVILTGVWVFNNIAEKEMDTGRQSKTDKNVVNQSKKVDVVNKSKGNDNSIQDSEDVRIQND